MNGQSSRVLCLQNCNLGCSTTGCSRTDIAQNEIIVLQFSEPVDENTVNSSSIRFRTPSGDEPVGEFFVNGYQVEFVPTLSITGGQTFYGFTTGETYTMTIIGGDNQPAVVRSTSGKPFGQTLTCTLRSVLGIQDLNQSPPSAILISPPTSQIDAAPLDAAIRLEFNELIDATPFLSGTQSPVEFGVRRTRAASGGGYECDPTSSLQTLSGTQSLSFDAARSVSILTFTPTQALPGNVCIEINVTDVVTDLSGHPAMPQSFVFRTVVVPLADFEITESFDDNLHFDADGSAGEWGSGTASFAKIGGDGRHGEFSLALCVNTGNQLYGKDLYELDCDNTIIPAENTTTGAALAVTDGRFFFSSMVVPSSVALRFVGSSAPVVTVAGKIEVLGVIDATGESLTTVPTVSTTPGQPGGAGAIFAGSGGAGGDKCLGLGASLGNYDGNDGGNARLLAGHAYLGSLASTGGRGSDLFPASGLNADMLFATMPPPTTPLHYALNAVAGGSGGGLFTAGGDGYVLSIKQNGVPMSNQTTFFGPVAPGGSAVQLFPFPPATGLLRSSLHFLAGGGGGGGSASNSTLSLALSRQWAPGAGGGGGGGAFALRAGRSLVVTPAGKLLAVGGGAASNIGVAAGPQVAPAGGGAGGSIVLQSGGTADLEGEINVSGGLGGVFTKTGGGGTAPGGGVVDIRGGNGGNGMVRFELPTQPQLSALSSMSPAATTQNVGALTELDDIVALRSTWYSTGLIFGPEFARYEISATVDGAPMLFSDDPAVSNLAAGVGAPLRVLFQAANLDLVTGEVLDPVLPAWRTSVRSSSNQTGIASDGRNAFRFMLLIDHALAADVVVDRVTVVYRN
ncbi:MAG: hypothetical protein H6835_07215 [Planctomycetes bacterium]|nr:hypothetical protein [Planctomycetota bacterium]